MKPSLWSSLLVGTILATTAGLARAEDVGPATIDPASVSAAIDAVAAADPLGRDEADAALITGSITALSGTKTPGLVPLAAPAGSALSEVKERPATPAGTPTVPASLRTEPPAPPAAPLSAKAASPAEPATPSAPTATAPTAPTPTATAPTSPAPTPTATAPSTPAPGDAATPAAATTSARVGDDTVQGSAPAPTAVEPAPTGSPSAATGFTVETRDDAAAPATTRDADAPDLSKLLPPAASAAAPAASDAAPSAPAAEPAAAQEKRVEAPAATVPGEAAPAPAVVAMTTAAEPAAPAQPLLPAEARAGSLPHAEPAAAAETPAAAPRAPEPTVTASTTPLAAPSATASTPLVAPPAAEPAARPTITPAEGAVAAAHAEQALIDALKPAIEREATRAGTADDRADRGALATLYAERGWRPLFVDPQGALAARGRALVARLARSDADGMEPRDYLLPSLRAETAEARADLEIATALTALRWARHMQSGRIDPVRVGELVTPRVPKPDPVVVLRALAESRDLAATLDGFAPPHEGWRRLKAELARLRAETETPVVRLPTGPTLKPGQKDARVAALRERLGVAVTATDAVDLYDPALAEAVKTFQRDRGLAATGALGQSTVAALNEEARGNADHVADLIVNMERWRWLPRELGDLHVFVNVPDFHLDVMKDGRSIHHARVVTGRPENQTPIFSETMEYVVVNPYWNVPYSIVKKEMLAKAQASGGAALSRGNFEVEVGNRAVDPTTVDWSTVAAHQVTIRQRPGGGNALGNIKFMFPNQHSVYIHDTSSRGLFANSYRALSHGCVRVHEPFAFADAVLSEEPGGLGGAQLKKMLGGGEKQVMLKRQVPVHIAYFTRFVDDGGHLETRRDVYGHDARMKRLLGL